MAPPARLGGAASKFMHADHNAEAGVRGYSIVVTSCGRFDLLRQTLQSLKENLDRAPEAWVIIEDSGDERVREVAAELGLNAEIILNRPQLGQMKSIDKAYARVKSAYVFHCEDDWEFFRKGFIAESFLVLEGRPDVSVVCLRPRSEQNKLVRDAPRESVAGVAMFTLNPALHPEYFSYSFNPGLRRMKDYHDIGPFAPLGHEEDVSYYFKRAGFRLANLEEPAVRHIGDDRHVLDPTQPKRAKSVWARLKRSVNKRIKRLRRAWRRGLKNVAF